MVSSIGIQTNRDFAPVADGIPGDLVNAPRPALSKLHIWMIVAAAMTGSILEILDTTITTTAVPQMMGNLGATLSEIGWVNTAYIVANVIVLPMAAWLANRLGRRNYFGGAVLLFTMASLCCGLSHDLTTLVFWRVVQGLGGGGLLATGQVIMLEAFPKDKQALPTAIYGAGVMSGPIFGPVLGGFLTENYSWPYIFFINLPFGLAAATLTYLYVTDTAKERIGWKEPIDYLGILLLAVGMGSLQTVLERGLEEDWFSSPLISWLSATALVTLVLFVFRQLQTHYPVINLRLLRDRSLSAGAVLAWVLGIGIYGLGFLLPVELQTLRGYNAFQSGLVQLPSGIAITFSFLLAGLFSQKLDPRIMMFIGCLGITGGTIGLGFLTTDSSNSEIIFSLVLRGFSLGLLFVPLTINSLTQLSANNIETGSAMISFTRQLGGSMGIAMLSTLLSRRTDFHRTILYGRLDSGNIALHDWVGTIQKALYHQGYSTTLSHHAALYFISLMAQRQAAMMAFNDCFLAIAAAFILALPVILIFKRSTGPARLVL